MAAGGGREHLVRRVPSSLVHVGGDLQEWYERDLGADADEQQQEQVTATVKVIDLCSTQRPPRRAIPADPRFRRIVRSR